MQNAEEYKKIIKELSPQSTVLKNSAKAFLFGGLICLIGELLASLYFYLGASEKNAYILVTVSLIFLASLLTGLGVFDKIARHAGAGTLVPITGFANAVVSPAMEFRREGLVMGVGAKLFTLAGPVLVYGISSSVIVGLITFFLDMM